MQLLKLDYGLKTHMSMMLANGGIELVTNGNNDDGLSDWKAIPEFGTLLMPIASILLIVGYNYRRRETEA